MIDDKWIGERIKAARKMVGYTQGDVAAEMDMSISTVSDIERGERSVTGPELHAFAELLKQPLDFFLTPAEGSGAAFSYLFREASERAASTPTLHEFERLCMDYRSLEEITEAPPPPKPPDYSGFGFQSLSEAERLASMERARLGLGDAPLADLGQLLDQEAGARIFQIPVEGDGLSGAVAYDRDGWPCILVNSKEPNYRRRFTIAHEYGHCLVHLRRSAHHEAALPAHIDRQNPEDHFLARDQRERFANAFAASFLMPRERVSELYERFVRVPGIFRDDMLYLMSRHFGVSIVALGWRLVTLRRISSRQWRKYLARGRTTELLARRFGDHEEPKAKETILPPRYEYLAWTAFEQEEISLSRLAELLRENLFELRERVRQRGVLEVEEFATRDSSP
jgi:Zn-dependent peptidase ImmA (M78 family)/transcriptional regulator with XRE-family HTH domain